MDQNNSTQSTYTVDEWLAGCVNFPIPESAIAYIMSEREVTAGTAVSDGNSETRRLMKADLYKWIVLGAGSLNNTSDADNGWSHSGGGYTLTSEDKRLLTDEANAIYEELEPASVFRKKGIRVRSAGIMPAARDLDGEPLPRNPLC